MGVFAEVLDFGTLNIPQCVGDSAHTVWPGYTHVDVL